MKNIGGVILCGNTRGPLQYYEWGTRAYGPLADCKSVSLRRQAGSIPAFPTTLPDG